MPVPRLVDLQLEMAQIETTTTVPVTDTAQSRKYLLFRLGEEQFGLDVMSVREIVGMHPLTTLPNSPAYLPGVINLRGRVVPVIDLRLRIEMAARPFDARTCLVVVDSGPEDGRALTALATDSVTEVCTVAESAIEKTPNPTARPASRHLRGLARVGGKVTLFLDVDELIRPDEEGGAADERNTV